MYISSKQKNRSKNITNGSRTGQRKTNLFVFFFFFFFVFFLWEKVPLSPPPSFREELGLDTLKCNERRAEGKKFKKTDIFNTFTCALVASKALAGVVLVTPFTLAPRSLRLLLVFLRVRRFRRRRRFVFFLSINKIDLQKEKRFRSHPRRRRRRQRADEERKKQKWEHGE